MPKESLKDKLDGNELDLSMSELSVVPVKEMAALPKATHIDLSCNLLTSLPEAFCRLTHIVQLDLSKNKLQELPEDFGGLSRLQHLDLLGNSLRTVPVSFCHLRSLKWMDLKNNPLDEQLKKVTGDCLDDNQCRACATRVVSYMKDVASHIERERQRKLKEEREREAAEKAKEEEEKRKKKAEKMAEKERRRQEHEARRALLRQQKQEADHAEVKEEKVANGTTERKTAKQAKGLSCCGVFLAMLVGLVAVLVGLYFYCDNYRKDEACIRTRAYLEHLTHKAQDLVAQYLH